MPSLLRLEVHFSILPSKQVLDDWLYSVIQTMVFLPTAYSFQCSPFQFVRIEFWAMTGPWSFPHSYETHGSPSVKDVYNLRTLICYSVSYFLLGLEINWDTVLSSAPVSILHLNFIFCIQFYFYSCNEANKMNVNEENVRSRVMSLKVIDFYIYTILIQ